MSCVMLSASASLVFNKNICTQNNAKSYIHSPNNISTCICLTTVCPEKKWCSLKSQVAATKKEEQPTSFCREVARASSSSMRRWCADSSASNSEFICCDKPFPIHLNGDAGPLNGDPPPLKGDLDLLSPAFGVTGKPKLALRSSTFTCSTIPSKLFSCSHRHKTRHQQHWIAHSCTLAHTHSNTCILAKEIPFNLNKRIKWGSSKDDLLLILGCLSYCSMHQIWDAGRWILNLVFSQNTG